MPPSTSGLASCEVGQHSLYQPPVSITSRLPSASSRTSVGWKSRLLDVTKSLSLLVKLAPLEVSTWRETFCMLNCATKTLSLYAGPKPLDLYRVTPVGAAAPSSES